MPQVLLIKENLSNLLELASDGNCSLLFEEINQHLASAKIDPCLVNCKNEANPKKIETATVMTKFLPF